MARIHKGFFQHRAKPKSKVVLANEMDNGLERKGLGDHVFYGRLRSSESKDVSLAVRKKNEGTEWHISLLGTPFNCLPLLITDNQVLMNPVSPFSTCPPETESSVVRRVICLSIGNCLSLSQ